MRMNNVRMNAMINQINNQIGRIQKILDNIPLKKVDREILEWNFDTLRILLLQFIRDSVVTGKSEETKGNLMKGDKHG